MSRISGMAERSEVAKLASPVSGALLATCVAVPEALLVVLEFVACFSGTQEMPWRLCSHRTSVHPHHGEPGLLAGGILPP